MHLLWNQVQCQKSSPKNNWKNRGKKVEMAIEPWHTRQQTYESAGIAVQLIRCIAKCFQQQLSINDSPPYRQIYIVDGAGTWHHFVQRVRWYWLLFAICTFQYGAVFVQWIADVLLVQMADCAARPFVVDARAVIKRLHITTTFTLQVFFHD